MFTCDSGRFVLNSLNLDQTRSSRISQQVYGCFFKVLPSYFLQKMIILTSVTISSLLVALWLILSLVLSIYFVKCSVEHTLQWMRVCSLVCRFSASFTLRNIPAEQLKPCFVGSILSQSVISHIGLILLEMQVILYTDLHFCDWTVLF